MLSQPPGSRFLAQPGPVALGPVPVTPGSSEGSCKRCPHVQPCSPRAVSRGSAAPAAQPAPRLPAGLTRPAGSGCAGHRRESPLGPCQGWDKGGSGARHRLEPPRNAGPDPGGAAPATGPGGPAVPNRARSAPGALTCMAAPSGTAGAQRFRVGRAPRGAEVRGRGAGPRGHGGRREAGLGGGSGTGPRWAMRGGRRAGHRVAVGSRGAGELAGPPAREGLEQPRVRGGTRVSAWGPAEPRVSRAAVLPPQVEEAGHVFLLMKKDYRISRNVRLAWVLSRLHQVIWAVPEPELVSGARGGQCQRSLL